MDPAPSSPSLVRRARTRTTRQRSSTISAPSSPRGRPGTPPPVPVPVSAGRIPNAAAKAESLAAFGELLDIVHRVRSDYPHAPPPVPPRSPRRATTTDDHELGSRYDRGRTSVMSTTTGSTVSAKRGLSLPRLPRKASSSTLSSAPSLQTPVHVPRAAFPSHARFESIETAKSGTDSSVYPLSSYLSRSDIPSPLTIAELDPDSHGFGPALTTALDTDDISYRLRLLVKNNYFLPPAHAKPSPADLGPTDDDSAAKKSRQNAPAFLDIFRKSRSKPTTPTGAAYPDRPPLAGPIVRTASDSTTVSGYLPRPAPSGSPTPVPGTPVHTERPRVVVVREKMDDLRVAAKQSERDIQARKDLRRVRSHDASLRAGAVPDFVDPTDVVDLPPPGAAYPFAVQASALHGLGVGESVGAALLAERLPPASAPGMWNNFEDSGDDSWRKALLKEAVALSLHNTPDTSSASYHQAGSLPSSPLPSPGASSMDTGFQQAMSTPSSPLPSPSIASMKRGQSPTSPSFLTTQTKTTLGQRIVDRPQLEVRPSEEKSPGSSVAATSPQTPTRRLGRPLDVTVPPPERSKTPAPTPLAPPPRKMLVNPLYSLSQTDLSSLTPSPTSSQRPLPSPTSSQRPFPSPTSSQRPSLSLPVPQLRRATSSPVLAREAGAFMMTPPPGMFAGRRAPSPLGMGMGTGVTPTPTESDDEEGSELPYHSTRPSLAESEAETRGSLAYSEAEMRRSIADSRPSFSQSEYSQPSPTVSAFRDALLPRLAGRMELGRALVEDRASPLARVSRDISRYYVVEPPPRSSSLSGPASPLAPPPRARRPFTAAPPVASSSSSVHSFAYSDPGRASSYHTLPAAPSPIPEIFAPEPTTPPFPTSPDAEDNMARAQRRGLAALTIPDVAEIRSGPSPASPIAFFDNIEARGREVLDEIDESDSESEGEEEALADRSGAGAGGADSGSEDSDSDSAGAPSLYVDPVSQAVSNRPSTSSSRPSLFRLGNHSTPQILPSRFASAADEPLPHRRPPVGNVPPPKPASTFFASRKRNLSAVTARPARRSGESAASAGSGASARPALPATPSMRQFDDMLTQHLQRERDQLRRITTTSSSSRQGHE